MLPKITIVPIVLSEISTAFCRSIGLAIAQAIDKEKVLLVASSDLYHGYSYEDCLQSDKHTLKALTQHNPDDFGDGIINGEYRACGGGPITALLYAAKQMGANAVKVIEKTNSSDVSGVRGDYVVGYAAVAVYKKE